MVESEWRKRERERRLFASSQLLLFTTRLIETSLDRLIRTTTPRYERAIKVYASSISRFLHSLFNSSLSNQAMKICVFGGSGLVGSSIAKKAVQRGWNVVSVSQSGKPFQTPAGHSPAWVDKVSLAFALSLMWTFAEDYSYPQVEWTKGTPFDSASYASVLPSCDALVSTLGILLEDNYKQKGQAQPLSVLKSILGNLMGEIGNPLKERGDRTYERMNRDSGMSLSNLSLPQCVSWRSTSQSLSDWDFQSIPSISISTLLHFDFNRSISLRFYLCRRHLPTVRTIRLHSIETTGGTSDIGRISDRSGRTRSSTSFHQTKCVG